MVAEFWENPREEKTKKEIEKRRVRNTFISNKVGKDKRLLL